MHNIIHNCFVRLKLMKLTSSVSSDTCWWPGLRRTTGFGIPGPMTQDRSWNLTLGLINQWLGGEFMASRQITQLATARASTYFSAFSTLRRNHHWVCWLPSIRPVTCIHIHRYMYIFVYTWIHIPAYIHNTNDTLGRVCWIKYKDTDV